MIQMDRRKFISAAISGSTVLMAGCNSLFGGGDDGTPTPTPTSTPTATPDGETKNGSNGSDGSDGTDELEERLAELEERLADLREERKDLEAKRDELEQSLAEKEQQKGELEQEITELEEAIAEAEASSNGEHTWIDDDVETVDPSEEQIITGEFGPNALDFGDANRYLRDMEQMIWNEVPWLEKHGNEYKGRFTEGTTDGNQFVMTFHTPHEEGLKLQIQTIGLAMTGRSYQTAYFPEWTKNTDMESVHVVGKSPSGEALFTATYSIDAMNTFLQTFKQGDYLRHIEMEIENE